ncbi:MAG: hypothetical protein JST54_22130 [Deltaproteobacteria bacterium]|nr:hypothetical protein [Deltaproteobacteria bacterium]
MPDAVALVPGFLGFDHLGERTYFADRFIGGLRGGLQARLGRAVPVIPLPTLPVSSLAERQRALTGHLAKLDANLGASTWHLLGHSTGGVDAALLTRKNALVDGPKGTIFGDAPPAAPRLGSVITLSAPHYGTGLALAPLAKLIAGGKPNVAGLADLARIGIDALQRDRFWTRLQFMVSTAKEGNPLEFVMHLLFGDALAHDLTPQVSGALTATSNRGDVPISCVATLAPPPNDRTEDHLYRDLWHWSATDDGEQVQVPPQPDFERARRIGSPPAGPIAAKDNDSIVNTVRQVDGTLLALVGGDHTDVLGRYFRADPVDGKVIDPGLITSGAGFRDDHFFELIDCLADGFAAQMKGAKGSSASA